MPLGSSSACPRSRPRAHLGGLRFNTANTQQHHGNVSQPTHHFQLDFVSTHWPEEVAECACASQRSDLSTVRSALPHVSCTKSTRNTQRKRVPAGFRCTAIREPTGRSHGFEKRDGTSKKKKQQRPIGGFVARAGVTEQHRAAPFLFYLFRFLRWSPHTTSSPPASRASPDRPSHARL